ncbi:uncharacterized protein TNCV_1397791 [Trichonephila clavipes]|nr:uncharacterized protein TNCV_1397791 [Trichonephila clavipes]
MSDSKVRKWVRKFKDGQTNVLDEERSSRPSGITDDLMQAVEAEISEHKEKRFAISLGFLIHYEEEGDDMLSRIVTGEETSVSNITPESKHQSMEWRHTSSPVKVEAKQTLLKRKIMATMFRDRRGDFLVDFMPQRTTIKPGA